MTQIKIQAEVRQVTGKKVRFLRRQGIIPANLYGHGIASVPLQLEARALENLVAEVSPADVISLKVGDAKRSKTVMLRGTQYDSRSGRLLHADFYQPRLTEKVAVDVPLVVIGEAPAVKTQGGTLFSNLTSVRVEGLPGELPRSIEVDVSGLEEIGAVLRVGDITVDDGVTILTDPGEAVASVARARVSVTPGAPAAELEGEEEAVEEGEPEAVEEGAPESTEESEE